MKVRINSAILCIVFLFLISTAHAQGIITTIAGNGVTHYIGDGWPATNYSLASPTGICIDKAGNIFEVDYAVPRVRRVFRDTLFTFAGTGVPSYTGDAGPATDATFRNPSGVAVDTSGNVYVLEEYNKVVRKIDRSTGIVTTVCGSGFGGFGGDGGAALSAKMEQPAGLCVDKSGNIYIADYGNQRIRKVDAATGIITTVAGNGVNGYSGDGGPATNTKLSYPKAVFADSLSNIYIADYGNNRIRRVDAVTGNISTVAGTGVAGYSGNEGPAVNAKLVEPTGLFMSKRGNLYIADFGNNVVRVVTPDGIIHTVVGSGSTGFSGDGGSALAATMQGPTGVCVDDSEYLYIADIGNSAIRKVTPVYVGVSDVKRSSTISVYPNPATDRLFLSGIDKGAKDAVIKIINTTGMVVYTGHAHSGEPVDVSNLANGMYLLFYTDRLGYYTTKFIVLR